MTVSAACLSVLLCIFTFTVTSSGQQKRATATPSRATYQKGVTALERGDLETARSAFEEAVRLSPSSAEAHNSLGWVLLAQGQIDASIVEFNSALKLKPAFAQAHINLANAFAKNETWTPPSAKLAKPCDFLQTAPKRIGRLRAS